ncbi:hypothetical protein CU097_014021 [Rhizopus azygosporus]|uniref:tRNA/rRNA methyltransferase SpoU type domain-containing protein n=1 Tax=Rhizopus azygosporus TaxID=86630 RepID=A0A367JZ83_RHIAZ|nr:hypothetical protein CU097_014021 [Rhizopus azygosporus]
MSFYKYPFPSLFKRIINQKASPAKHLIALRESKQYRQENQAVVVQGLKTIRELRDQGIKINSLIVTAKKEPKEAEEVKFPANSVLENPDSFPAKKYYLTDVDLTRRILGTASRPGRHEVYAEVALLKHTFEPQERMLVLDKVNDPGNLGTIVRTAKGLGWKSGIITSGTCDLYNDKAIRASRAMSITWPHTIVSITGLLDFLKKHNITPIVADMLPKNDDSQKVWSPDYGHSNVKDVEPGSGIWFWNFQGERLNIPEKVALVLSCEHNGVDEALDHVTRVSIPLASNVESLNVASAGSIIMAEMNRLLRQRVRTT